MPEKLYRKRRTPGAKAEPGDYTLSGSGKGNPAMNCQLCNEYPPLRSNLGVAEEVYRLIGHLEQKEPACPSESCAMQGVPFTENVANYVSNGKTAAGSPRWKCKACGKTFTHGGKSIRKQRITHKNRDVFILLVNKTPIKRICEITGLGPEVVYGKINFIHNQCMAFVGDRERQLIEDFDLPKMCLAVDRQSYVVNWSSRRDRRNVQLNAIGSADLASGYVLGMHLNFDGSLNPDEVEADTLALDDYSQDPPFRRYARLWLKKDYDVSIAASATAASRKIAKALAKGRSSDELSAEIAGRYIDATERNDVEESDEKDKDVALPEMGVQVHEQYTMYAHFLLLSRLLIRAEKVRIYMDQDSGFRAAFMAAFHSRVKTRTADAFFVSLLKESTIDEKNIAITKSRALIKKYQDSNPDLTPFEVEVLMVKEEMKRMATIGKWGDRWLLHPFPNKSEPDKRICWLTDLGDYEEDHAARLYLKGSLHAIDRFFMQTRRRLSLAERPYASASKNRRMWHGYSAYKPQNLAKMLDIFRVFYNYCLAGKDGKTPAMRLGLAKGKVELEDIIYYA